MLSNTPIFFPVMLALFGLLIGSFLNVCIYRVMRDLSVVTPRSFCPECEQPIAWFDNIPVLSYVLLSAKCRHCANPIPVRYPLVEVLTAVTFASVALRYGQHLPCLKWCVFEALMITLFFTDLEERILPDEFTIGGTCVGVIFAFLVRIPGIFSELLLSRSNPPVQTLFEAAMGAILMTGPIWFLAWFWGRLRKREMLGLGDVKLLPLIGVFLGLERGITALLIGSVAGVLLGGGYMALTRKKAASYELPMGSFFCLGAGLVPLLSAN